MEGKGFGRANESYPKSLILRILNIKAFHLYNMSNSSAREGRLVETVVSEMWGILVMKHDYFIEHILIILIRDHYPIRKCFQQHPIKIHLGISFLLL